MTERPQRCKQSENIGWHHSTCRGCTRTDGSRFLANGSQSPQKPTKAITVGTFWGLYTRKAHMAKRNKDIPQKFQLFLTSIQRWELEQASNYSVGPPCSYLYHHDHHCNAIFSFFPPERKVGANLIQQPNLYDQQAIGNSSIRSSVFLLYMIWSNSG